MTKVDTSAESVERLALTSDLFAKAMKVWHEKTHKHHEDVRDTLRTLLSELCQSQAREKSMKDSSQECREYLMEINSLKFQVKQMRKERDYFQNKLSEAEVSTFSDGVDVGEWIYAEDAYRAGHALARKWHDDVMSVDEGLANYLQKKDKSND